MGTDDKVGWEIREPTTPYDDWTGASGIRGLPTCASNGRSAGQAWARPFRVERALRDGQPCPDPGTQARNRFFHMGTKVV